MNRTIAGIAMPDSAMARGATERVRATESALMFHHAQRAFLFGALTGYRENLVFDIELLYVGAMFHNVGLNIVHRGSSCRYEVDSANAARDFMREHKAAASAIDEVWLAVALHTTPGIPEHLAPLAALLAAGVQMDVRGACYDEFAPQQREEIVEACPREAGFKKRILEEYARGMECRPHTTFGTVNADVLDRWDPNYRRLNFCGLVLGSEWPN